MSWSPIATANKRQKISGSDRSLGSEALKHNLLRWSHFESAGGEPCRPVRLARQATPEFPARSCTLRHWHRRPKLTAHAPRTWLRAAVRARKQGNEGDRDSRGDPPPVCHGNGPLPPQLTDLAAYLFGLAVTLA